MPKVASTCNYDGHILDMKFPQVSQENVGNLEPNRAYFEQNFIAYFRIFIKYFRIFKINKMFVHLFCFPLRVCNLLPLVGLNL